MFTTVSGRPIDLDNMTPDDFRIEDIAHHLAMLCRFGGATKKFYSVAQHSVRIHDAAPDRLKKQALLHDATEAYVQDLIQPVKARFPEYKLLEKQIYEMIAARFDLPQWPDPEIKVLDVRALYTEAIEIYGAVPEFWIPAPETFFPLPSVRYLDPESARIQFLSRWRALEFS